MSGTAAQQNSPTIVRRFTLRSYMMTFAGNRSCSTVDALTLENLMEMTENRVHFPMSEESLRNWQFLVF